ncbi:hypothetical protein PUMCH_000216 [Australozyma saopauloensis]|uniref:Opaque-phase-specific protein OP4 n=1 Tax=Australozyma saopauloensis TaxID=291208 RepID=A0AAX4H3D0_9ASCO|nr:hypothetical protein PUMCH_000216 [[Candida] saopauloensis]
MKFSNTALAVLATSAVVAEAAPTQMTESTASDSLSLIKRQELENALSDLNELKMMREKRELLESELSAREYTIVTNVLDAIKDTNLAPVVLKYFTSNVVLQAAAVQGILFVIKSNLISAATLLKYLTQSGLITSVINDIIADCGFFAQVLGLLKSELGNIFKRDEPYTHEEGLELLRRDGLIEETEFDNLEMLDKRAVDDVINNVLDSLAKSGLATQVVEAALVDPKFYRFSALLIGVLYAQGLLKLQPLVQAVSQSGLVPALLSDLLNVLTLKTIASTAVNAFLGKCGSTVSSPGSTRKNGTAIATSSSATSGSKGLGSLLGALLGGGSLLGGLGSLFGSLSGRPSSSATAPKASVTYIATPVATKAISAATTTIATPIANPCTTAARLFKRERLNMYY